MKAKRTQPAAATPAPSTPPAPAAPVVDVRALLVHGYGLMLDWHGDPRERKDAAVCPYCTWMVDVKRELGL